MYSYALKRKKGFNDLDNGEMAYSLSPKKKKGKYGYHQKGNDF